MDKLPFPALGLIRVWPEEFVRNKRVILSELKWIEVGKLISINTEIVPPCSGVYCFVRKGAIETITPWKENGYPLIVYVGRSSNLQIRLKDYLDDKRAVMRRAQSARKVRDGIKVMFREFDNDLIIYYALCLPDHLIPIEDALIQIIDPIFNSDQRLNEDDFDAFHTHIGASIETAHDAYDPDIEPKGDSVTTPKELPYGVGDAEQAF